MDCKIIKRVRVNGVDMLRVVHFEINADNAERAVKFYSQVFGWMAYCQDTEGNVFGIMQSDGSAH